MTAKQDQNLFINRELSWLDFNRRVLDLAKDKSVPLGEQMKFAAIYGSNLDEFFMVRVGSLYDRTLLKAVEIDNKTGMTPAQQLAAIMPKVAGLQQHCDKIVAKLFENAAKIGYKKVDFSALTKEQSHFWKKYFLTELLPILSPQIVDRRHPFPFLRNNQTYVGTMLRQKNEAYASFGLIPVSTQYSRIIFAPDGDGVAFALVEELILHFCNLVFGKKAVQSRCIFRVTRNADITVEEGMFDHDVDYRVVMSELLKKRRKLAAVRLQVSPKAPQEIVGFLCQKLMLPAGQVFEQTAPLDLSFAYKIASRMSADGHSDLFYPPRRPMLPGSDYSLAKVIRSRDVLIQYPYQSMRPFLRLLMQAAVDPAVISIKMTLYRMAHESKIIEALCTAAERGKEVVTIVELRARFDEQNNIDFARQLEEAGCTVIYGFENYKIHSKLCLITRKTEEKLEYISQIGTGNYNEKTSELYTDLSYITTDPQVGEELANVFNNLAVETLTETTGRLLIAPRCFKSKLMKEMDEEIRAKKEGRPASIILKCNSISDKDIIEKISEASCAGVKVQMIVRGICCIRAGVPGLTENVTVRSIVGRYLEHSRIYAFGTEKNRRIYIASGDFLTRNTQRRVEAGVLVTDKTLMKELMSILQMQLNDNVNAREMQPDGTYARVKRAEGEPVVDSQLGMYDLLADAWKLPEAIREVRAAQSEEKSEPVRTELSVVPEKTEPQPVEEPRKKAEPQPHANARPAQPQEYVAMRRAAVRPVRRRKTHVVRRRVRPSLIGSLSALLNSKTKK